MHKSREASRMLGLVLPRACSVRVIDERGVELGTLLLLEPVHSAGT